MPKFQLLTGRRRFAAAGNTRMKDSHAICDISSLSQGSFRLSVPRGVHVSHVRGVPEEPDLLRSSDNVRRKNGDMKIETQNILTLPRKMSLKLILRPS